MTTINPRAIRITDLASVCIVVHDLEKSMEQIGTTFGIGPWEINIRDCNSNSRDESISDMTYYGKPARFSYKVAHMPRKLGGMEIELIQPLGGENIYSDFLKENGEGIHHLGWYVVDSPEEFIETRDKLEKEGFPCIMSASVYGAKVGYFDTTKVLNTILEVHWLDPSVIRHPSRVFPE